MGFDDTSDAPSNSYLVNLRGATGGQFTLKVYDSVNDRTTSEPIDYPFDVNDLESILQRTVIPIEEEYSCGKNATSKCTNAVKVYEVGDGFAVFFVGERNAEEVTLSLLTDQLVGFESEYFQNKTIDILEF